MLKQAPLIQKDILSGSQLLPDIEETEPENEMDHQEQQERIYPEKYDSYDPDNWDVDNKMPCPLCDPPKWVSRPNIARHCKQQHSDEKIKMNPALLYRDHYESALEMLKAKVEEQ